MFYVNCIIMSRERYKWLDERAIAKHGKTPFKGDTSTATVTPLDSTTGLSVTCNDDTGSGGDGWQKKGGSSGYTLLCIGRLTTCQTT